MMTIPDWLADPKGSDVTRFWIRVIFKGLVLYVLFNVAFAIINPMPTLEQMLFYNHVVPGLERFPGGVYRLPVLFDSHVISQPKADNEYRVMLLGDSSTYGAQLAHEDTLAGVLNSEHWQLIDGRNVRVYNLAYPHGSVSRDFMLLDYAMRYDPDMIVWLVTGSTLIPDELFNSPLLKENPEVMRDLITRYDLAVDPDDGRFAQPPLFESTLLGQRYALYSWLRLQMEGIVWGITGIDHFWPHDLQPVQNDFEVEEPVADADDITWGLDVLSIALTRAGDVPTLLINEPIFISDGKNSHLYYNEYYKRTDYRVYRDLLRNYVDRYALPYLDLWNLIPSDEFRDTPLHYSPAGAEMLAERIGPAIVSVAAGESPS